MVSSIPMNNANSPSQSSTTKRIECIYLTHYTLNLLSTTHLNSKFMSNVNKILGIACRE